MLNGLVPGFLMLNGLVPGSLMLNGLVRGFLMLTSLVLDTFLKARSAFLPPHTGSFVFVTRLADDLANHTPPD